jgi:hypothetical protein
MGGQDEGPRIFPLVGGGYVVTSAHGDAETVFESQIRIGGSVNVEVERLEGLVVRLREAVKRVGESREAGDR